MKIIPAIDIIDGKCVRLSQGDYAHKKVYHENPLEVAKTFADAGIEYLHLVDLDGARQGKVINWRTLEQICQNTLLRVDFGGGIKTKAEVRQVLETGARQINLGSIAVKEPEKVSLWVKEFGADKIILSADVRGELIALHGWTETSSLTITEFITQYQLIGIRYVTCTDIRTDGMLTGPNLELYRMLLDQFPDILLIGSGGVSAVEDLQKLSKIGMYGTIIGKAIYEGRISLEALSTLKQP